MNATETKLKDCWIIEPRLFEDDRGYFFESFNFNRFKEATGIDFEVKQINQSKSSRGVLRGLHFQTNPKAQAKLVSCIEGKVLDIAVDLRKNSASYKQYFGVILSEENKKQLYIPKGMAHGFLVLTNEARIMYQVDEIYSPDHDDGIAFDDPEISIDWSLPFEELILSEKDKNLRNLSETNLDF